MKLVFSHNDDNQFWVCSVVREDGKDRFELARIRMALIKDSELRQQFVSTCQAAIHFLFKETGTEINLAKETPGTPDKEECDVCGGKHVMPLVDAWTMAAEFKANGNKLPLHRHLHTLPDAPCPECRSNAFWDYVAAMKAKNGEPLNDVVVDQAESYEHPQAGRIIVLTPSSIGFLDDVLAKIKS